MKIENIYPANWQETRGVYSPAKKIDMGDYYLVFVSGQQARKNNNNEVTSDIEQQTNEVFESIEEILKSAGTGMNNIVKAVIYLTDMQEFKNFSSIRDKWFNDCKPVSTLVEVNGMTRKGAKVEIEVTALIKKWGKQWKNNLLE